MILNGKVPEGPLATVIVAHDAPAAPEEVFSWDIQTNLTSLGDATKNGGFVIQKYLKLIPHNLSPKQKLDFKA